VIPTAQIVAAGVHLERLVALARAADEVAREVDYHRRRQLFRPGAVLVFFAPLLVAWWIVLGLGVGVGAIFGVFALAPQVANNEIVGSMLAVGGMLIWAGWVALLRLFLTRRRAVIAELPAAAADARCGRCGATAPVLIGHAMQCPFCAADLIPDDAARRAAEAHVQRQVTHLRAQAVVETMRIDASRIPALENLIAMITVVQLIPIGFACVVSVVAIIMAIAKALG
jgi:hypothetical protein